MKRLVIATILLALGGCAVRHSTTESTSLGRYNFGYIVNGRSDALTQIFNDGANTFMQLSKPWEQRNLSLRRCGSKKLLKSSLKGQYVLVAGIHDQLCVELTGKQKKLSLQVQRVTDVPSAVKSSKY